MFISIACLTTDLVSAAKKRTKKQLRLRALETAVDQLNDGLDLLMKKEEVVATKLKAINSTVQEIKEGKDAIYSDLHPSKKKKEKETKSKKKRHINIQCIFFRNCVLYHTRSLN